MHRLRIAHLAVLSAVITGALGAGTGDAQALTVQTDMTTIQAQSGETVRIWSDASGRYYTFDGVTHNQLLGDYFLDIDFQGNPGTVILDGSVQPLGFRYRISATRAALGSRIELKGAIRLTDGTEPTRTISFDAPVVLTGDTTITTPTSLGGQSTTVAFDRTVDGAHSLDVQVPFDFDAAGIGTVILGGAVGGTTPLTSFAVATGSFTPGSLIATTGAQTYSSSTEVILGIQSVRLLASRVTQTGWISCDPCSPMPALTVDVSEVRDPSAPGTTPGSTVEGVGSAQNPGGTQLRLVKAGAGTLSFGSTGYNNRYTGGSTIDDGTIRWNHANALGTGSVVVEPGGRLDVAGLVVPGGAPSWPAGISLRGPLVSSGSAATIPVPITLLDDARIGAGSNARLTLTGGVTAGDKDVILEGPVDVATTIATTGAVRVASSTTLIPTASLATTGTLLVDGDVDLLPGGTPITLSATRLGGFGTIRCGLVGSGSCGEVSIDVSDATGATAFNGGFGGTTGQQSVMTIAKRGAGTLVLSGTSTIQGTDVAAGELRVTQTGRVEQAATVDVAAGARLSGNGTVGVHNLGGGGLAVDGLLDLDGPNGPETMTTSALGIGGGTLEVGVDGPSAHSELLVANSVTLAGSSQLRVRAGASIPNGTTVVIVRTTFASPIMGTFAGLPEGAIVTPASGRGTFRITYAGGDGDDIALTYIPPAPEPERPADPPGNGTTTLTATKPRFAKGALITMATVTGAGRIVQTATTGGRAKATRACRATRTAPEAGTYRITCRLTTKVRAALKRGKLRLAVTTTFTPTGGTATTTRATVTVPRSR